ncbi:MAG: RES family NAD+ phosphorylase, partial [Acidobacteriota bacterium]
MGRPPVTLLRQLDTHRLIPSRHLARADSVLMAIVADEAHLDAIVALDTATNDRLLAERRQHVGIGLEELVSAVPHAQVINASFCHAHPLGSRFSGPDRGAWYAAFDVATAQAEVGFHKSVQLAEIGRFEDSVTYDDYLADFSASFHDLRSA